MEREVVNISARSSKVNGEILIRLGHAERTILLQMIQNPITAPGGRESTSFRLFREQLFKEIKSTIPAAEDVPDDFPQDEVPF